MEDYNTYNNQESVEKTDQGLFDNTESTIKQPKGILTKLGKIPGVKTLALLSALAGANVASAGETEKVPTKVVTTEQKAINVLKAPDFAAVSPEVIKETVKVLEGLISDKQKELNEEHSMYYRARGLIGYLKGMDKTRGTLQRTEQGGKYNFAFYDSGMIVGYSKELRQAVIFSGEHILMLQPGKKLNDKIKILGGTTKRDGSDIVWRSLHSRCNDLEIGDYALVVEALTIDVQTDGQSVGAVTSIQ